MNATYGWNDNAHLYKRVAWVIVSQGNIARASVTIR